MAAAATASAINAAAALPTVLSDIAERALARPAADVAAAVAAAATVAAAAAAEALTIDNDVPNALGAAAATAVTQPAAGAGALGRRDGRWAHAGGI